MFSPLLRLLATQPHLIAEHAHAYGSLIGEEIQKTTAAWGMRAALLSLAALMFIIAAILGGVALMLWAVIDPSSIRAPWALIVAPGVPAVLAIACGLAGRRAPADPFKDLKAQLAADMALIREAGAA